MKNDILKDEYVIQKDNPGALVNKDVYGLQEYEEKRKAFYETKEKLNEVELIKNDVDSIKNDLSELKNLLLKVLENGGK
jgi:hypothetical protein